MKKNPSPIHRRSLAIDSLCAARNRASINCAGIDRKRADAAKFPAEKVELTVRHRAKSSIADWSRIRSFCVRNFSRPIFPQTRFPRNGRDGLRKCSSRHSVKSLLCADIMLSLWQTKSNASLRNSPSRTGSAEKSARSTKNAPTCTVFRKTRVAVTAGRSTRFEWSTTPVLLQYLSCLWFTILLLCSHITNLVQINSIALPKRSAKRGMNAL